MKTSTIPNFWDLLLIQPKTGKNDTGLQDAIRRIEELLKTNFITSYLYKIAAIIYILLSFTLYYTIVNINNTSECMQFIGFSVYIWFIAFAIILFLQ